MAVVVWFSRYEPLPAQVEALKKIYGEDVEIKQVNRRFESLSQFLEFLRDVDAKGVYAVLPLEKIQELMNTDIGKKIDWLWAEYEDIYDGVRTEEEKGFEPDTDIAGYYYNLGQHRRFTGFSKILHYELKTQPLLKMENVKLPEKKKWTKQEWNRAWQNAYRDMYQEIQRNAVKVYVDPPILGQELKEYTLAVEYDKDTPIFDELRPKLKEMGFEWNGSFWVAFRITPAEAEKHIKRIEEIAKAVGENVARRILQKYGLPENKAKFLFDKMSQRAKIFELKKFTKDMEKVVFTDTPPKKSHGMGL